MCWPKIKMLIQGDISLHYVVRPRHVISYQTDHSDSTDLPVHDDLYHSCNQPMYACRTKLCTTICSMFFYCFVIKEFIYLRKNPQGFEQWCHIISQFPQYKCISQILLHGGTEQNFVFI